MNNLIDALQKIPVANLSYQEWINIGMALKNEGYDVSVWDSWSSNDSRYRRGVCERKWDSFKGSNNPVTGGTIIQMAQSYGWMPFEDGELGWNDEIENDGDADFKPGWKQANELITYLETVFKPNDYVGFVTNDVWFDDGKWLPSRGVCDRTAGELIRLLKKNTNDIGAVIGDWKEEAGAWIRFNPLDGNGVKNENVAAYRFALVESDTLSIDKQKELFISLQLPIACLVHSGGKSLHAIVHVDAKDYDEYKERVAFLYDYLSRKGVEIDKQNRNPSRLSRMPGVTRNGNKQFLVATNIGKSSWQDWVTYVECEEMLPAWDSLDDFEFNRPKLAPELIKGVLRCGHKLLISGSSKAGKSFLLMELCIAIAEGYKWLSFECKKGKVLYVNLEIDKPSCINRFLDIYDALGIPGDNKSNIKVWNLRGKSMPLDKLVPLIIEKIEYQGFDAVVIDPIYKVITGDENNASDMANFCNQFDKICDETGCSVIYCHHHSKGTQGSKRAMDRASGSGVFARDPDAQLDMIQLELTDELENYVRDGNATAWRMESSLREFANIKPVNFWFEYPIHRVDINGDLKGAYAEGSPQSNLSKSPKRTTTDNRKHTLDSAYDATCNNGFARIQDMVSYSGLTRQTLYRYLAEFTDEYSNDKGIITRITSL